MEHSDDTGDVEVIAVDPELERLKQSLEAQHAWHGILADALMELGGRDYVVEFGRQYPGRFLKMFSDSVPRVMPTAGVQGEVILKVHPTLQLSELDKANGD